VTRKEQTAARTAAHARRELAFPGLFVLLWSTGFIAAKYGLPYAPPFKFLFYRFLFVAALMGVVSLATRAPWPGPPLQWLHVAVVAWLVHGAYLGGVFVAIAQGMPAGTAAMLVGLQPLLTVVLAWLWLDESVSARQWLGLALGLAGVWLVVQHRIGFEATGASLVAVTVAVIGISIGTLYQKRFCARVDLRSGAVVQFVACALAYAPLAFLLEERAVAWTPSFALALGWSVCVLSVGAISVLYWLLRHGAAANVARLFYLVPPVTALQAYVLFGEALTRAALGGMVLIAVGVALSRSPAARLAAR
jgi:drug/metabolite transporter (DMT)-like permease